MLRGDFRGNGIAYGSTGEEGEDLLADGEANEQALPVHVVEKDVDGSRDISGEVLVTVPVDGPARVETDDSAEIGGLLRATHGLDPSAGWWFERE